MDPKIFALILKVFIGLPLILMVVFTLLALIYKKMGIYITGIIVSFIYFVGATEGIVYAFNKYTFFFDPYEGGYELLVVNIKYHWPFTFPTIVTIKNPVPV